MVRTFEPSVTLPSNISLTQRIHILGVSVWKNLSLQTKSEPETVTFPQSLKFVRWGHLGSLRGVPSGKRSHKSPRSAKHSKPADTQPAGSVRAHLHGTQPEHPQSSSTLPTKISQEVPKRQREKNPQNMRPNNKQTPIRDQELRSLFSHPRADLADQKCVHQDKVPRFAHTRFCRSSSKAPK